MAMASAERYVHKQQGKGMLQQDTRGMRWNAQVMARQGQGIGWDRLNKKSQLSQARQGQEKMGQTK